jgi:hypothetical protein
MSTWSDVKYLVGLYLPNEPLSGKGVTTKSLIQKLMDAHILNENGVLMADTFKFPAGPGFELVDMEVLLKLPDDSLSKTCQTDRYLSTICASNEFWRRKLSRLLDLDIKMEVGVQYKELYFDFRDRNRNSVVLIAVLTCNVQIFDAYIKSYNPGSRTLFSTVSKSMLCDNPYFFIALCDKYI